MDLLPTSENPARVLVGDALETLRRLPAGCVHCVATSPPYWALRDYRCDGQIGLEKTPGEFIGKLVAVFEEVRRVLHPSGTCWVNMGDSYNAGSRSPRKAPKTSVDVGGWNDAEIDGGSRVAFPGLKVKDLCGVPWRLVFALQAAGWYLRSDIIWHKPSPMPESVTDRPTKSHEYVFMLTKSPRYFYDAEAVREESVGSEKSWRFAAGWATSGDHTPAGWNQGDRADKRAERPGDTEPMGSRNKRSVWTVPTAAYPEAHFATFPPALVEPMVKAGSSEKGCCPECFAPWVRQTERKRKPTRPGRNFKPEVYQRNKAMASELSYGNRDPQRHCTEVTTLGWQPSCQCDAGEPIPSLVLDIFGGTGTTVAVAVKLKRRGLMIELNPEYAKLAERRLAEPLCVGGLFPPTAPVVRTLFDPDPPAARQEDARGG